MRGARSRDQQPPACDNFLYGFKGTPPARQAARGGKALSLSAGHQQGKARDQAGGPLPGKGSAGHPSAEGAAAWRRASSAARTGTAPPPPGGQPRTRPPTVPAVTHPRWPHRQELPGGPPAPAILSPCKDHRQGRSGLRPARRTRRRCAPPLTLIFHGKIGAYREDGGSGEIVPHTCHATAYLVLNHGASRDTELSADQASPWQGQH